MSVRPDRGLTFAGCQLNGLAGRGAMGVVFRLTQLAVQRSAAVEAIAPELAADAGATGQAPDDRFGAAPAIHPPATWIESAPTVNELARTATVPT